ncbi:5'/3'-nucleotidase SurE [Streptomyces gobiensis]|uniref:5'/3'-nucleotidase SurE n=1 Tax=Streptomyces gobiensis TaxID=2875706 RepID=UPI001E5BBC78|nr:5'/3'-nucleotidase SurE [Streptomyces gobiensis]UGY92171.1 5'/3'-nucleotidase SurE [Streptomyces gobiensis]
MRRKRVLSLAALVLCTPTLAGTAPAAASPQAAPASPLRILLTNDDGYDAPGIQTMFRHLTAAGHNVTIVAPLTDQSGTGTKITNAPTMTVKHPEPHIWAVDGTPGDSVAFGFSAVFTDQAPDLVISGANFGLNVAGLATHSGTVGGAVAALEYGVPTIAVSTGPLSAPELEPTLAAMKPTSDYTVKLIDRLRSRAKSGPLLPEGTGLNVNHPVIGADGTGTARGTSLTTQDPQPVIRPHFTHAGDDTWKVTTNVAMRPAQKGGDLEALIADKVSLTPIAPNWNTGPADFGKTAALLRGLRP